SFFRMFVPPLISPLFPYTTLFRSHVCQACFGSLLLQCCRDRKCDRTGHGHYDRKDHEQLRKRHTRREARFHRSEGPSPASIGKQDRKSTRLNSSHGSISYAVFCLK